MYKINKFQTLFNNVKIKNILKIIFKKFANFFFSA